MKKSGSTAASNAAEPISKKQPAVVPQQVYDEALSSQVNAAFDLVASSLVRLDVPDTPESPFTAVVPVDDNLLTLDLTPHSVRTPDYQLLAQVEDGSFVLEAPGPVRTMRGVVLEIDDSVVAASLLPEGLLAKILMPSGERIWIEPLRSKLPAAGEKLHVVYHDEDVLSSGGTCDTEVGLIPDEDHEPPAGPRGGTACGTGLCFAEMANDADFDYFQDYGSVAAVEAQVETIVNAINLEYEQDVDITHVISAIVVRTSDPADPYTSTDSLGLVNQVQAEWETNLDDIPRDITQLFTGKNIDGSTIGRAYDIGAVCTSGAYSFSQSDCCSFSCKTDLHAHENGHVWNGIHCSPCGTMTTPLSCANFFSEFSIDRISSHRDSRTCLATSGGGLVLPFFENFPSTTIESTNWIDISGAESNTLGANEPSPPNSLNIDVSDSITSEFMNTSNLPNGSISYWWQRTGNGGSPEAGDDLLVEYLNNVNEWTLLATHPGDGPDGQPFTLASTSIPANGQHSFFRLRFRGTGVQADDDWFVDDVTIDTGDILAPTPDPMTFAVTPPTALSDTEIMFEATTAVDDLGGVEYKFTKIAGAACCGVSSAWQASPTFVATGLRANSSYAYTVKARDTATPVPNQTAESAAGSRFTFIETPFEIVLLDAQDTQLTIMMTCEDTGASIRCVGGAFTDLSIPPSAIYVDMTPLEGSGSNDWIFSTAIHTITGLTPNTTYTFKAKARNHANQVQDETPFSAEFMFSTTGGVICPNMMPGDINQDGMIEGDDVGGYVRAKLGLPAEPGESQGCADFGTGTLDGDTQAFVTALLN